MQYDKVETDPAVQGEGAAARLAGHGQQEVSRLLAVIADQIAEADRRHGEALAEMKSRLHQLGSDARGARPQVPNEFAPAFSRIEDALTQLAERISDVSADRSTSPTSNPTQGLIMTSLSVHQPETAQSPIALRSAAPGTVPSFNWAADFARNRADQQAPDPFDIVDSSGMPKDENAWSASDAEALTQVYENDAVEPAPVQMVDNPGSVSIEAPRSAGAPASAYDREWLDERFAELTDRLQASLAGQPIHQMLSTLDERLGQLENHLGVSLQDVAKRSDVEGFRLVEAHIEEIARHLEETQGQLGRLDGIEAQLNEVVEHLAAQFETHPAAATSIPVEQLQRIAEEAAQSMATRFAGSMGNAAQGDGSSAHAGELASVRALLESYIGERRDGDEHNALMLDTLQQALIRVLDRMDTMEQNQAKPTYAAPQPAMVRQEAMVPRQRDADYRAPDSIAYQTAATLTADPAGGFDEDRRAEFAKPAAAIPAVAETALASQTEPRSSIEKLRQDFVADAQRAKLRASASQLEVPVKNPDGVSNRGRGPAPLTADSAMPKAGINRVSPKLIIAAIALMAVLGVGGMWNFGSPAPTMAPATAAAPEASAPAEAPAAAQAPAKPQASAPQGAVNGMVFEADPDEAAARTPSKISNEALTAPPGIRLRQSSEPVSPMNLAILQHQQSMANLSTRLGETAVNTMTPASFMKEMPINFPAATAVDGAKAADAKGSALDLPPVTVGPLSLRLAAAKGDASAEFEAASRLAEGKGTSQNFKEAVRWYMRSAAQGFAQSQYRLGTLYERGLGVKADAGMARSWYQRAAEQGNVKAMHNLAVLNASRTNGSPDYDSAAKWFTTAAERDLQDSQYNLGVLYESGLGVGKDAKQAMKWFSLAARGGDGESVRRRDSVKAQLTAQDQASVASAVAAFSPVKIEDPLINDARAAGEDWKKRAGVEGQG